MARIANAFTVVVALSSLSAVASAQQAAPYIAPMAPNIVKTYDKGAGGLDLFAIRSVAIEPVTGALWIQFGKESDPPIRIDRATGAVKTIGRTGAGPDEFTRIIAMVPGAHADIGIWDPGRRLWFWVDSAGRQRRTWSMPTNNLDYGHVYADVHGNVFLAQPISFTNYNEQVVVRLDSAKGLRDSTPLPIKSDNKWTWTAKTGNWSSSTFVRYSPSVLWAVDANGRLVTAWSDSNFVAVREGAKDVRRLLPSYREPLGADERAEVTKWLDQFEQSAKQRGARLEGPRPPVPATRPQIDVLLPEMNGGIVVTRSRVCSAIPDWRAPGTRAPAPDGKGRCTIVERFDATGRRLRPFTLGPDDMLRVVRGDTAWVIRENADGLQRVVEMVIPKG